MSRSEKDGPAIDGHPARTASNPLGQFLYVALGKSVTDAKGILVVAVPLADSSNDMRDLMRRIAEKVLPDITG